MRSTQTNIFDQLQTTSQKREQKRRLTHGGSLAKGKRKSRRPLSTKKWIHLTLKSHKAKGAYSMLAPKNAKWIDQLVRTKAKKFRVDLKDYVNMGNHLHFQIRIAKRESFQNFLRSITNLIARHVTGARKGKPFGKFWQDLAYTRVLMSFLELTQLQYYFTGNEVERRSGYQARKRYLNSANVYIQRLRLGIT